jgi:hypothetical protein
MAVPVIAAAAALGVASKISGGLAAQKAGRAEARFLEAEATQVQVVSVRETRDEAKQTERELARARAVFAASGVDTAGTNAASFLSAVREESNIRKGRIRRDADFTSRQLRLRAKAARASGNAALTSAFLGAGGTALSAGSKVVGRAPKSRPSGGGEA